MCVCVHVSKSIRLYEPCSLQSHWIFENSFRIQGAVPKTLNWISQLLFFFGLSDSGPNNYNLTIVFLDDFLNVLNLIRHMMPGVWWPSLVHSNDYLIFNENDEDVLHYLRSRVYVCVCTKWLSFVKPTRTNNHNGNFMEMNTEKRMGKKVFVKWNGFSFSLSRLYTLD